MALDMDMFTVAHTIGSILCCKCGILMQPNAANMCVKCLQTELNITDCLPRHVDITHCPQCDRYLQPPSTWKKAQLESKELLDFCLKRLDMKNLRLVHAVFIWTEPHSKRIKVKLKVQGEVIHGAKLEQPHIVEYKVHDIMCATCLRVQNNPDQWTAVVQLRQHVSHRRTFFYLEQLILKHNAVKDAIRIKQMGKGIDFFFHKHSHGKNFVQFLGNIAPIKSEHAKQLVSHDSKNNECRYKYTISVEISPICREDLICLPRKVAVSLGNLGPLVICNRVNKNIVLMDPFTLRQSFLSADQYWRSPFKALLSSRQLVEYIVLDVDAVSSEVNIGGSKYVLADVQVARLSDLGKNDMIFCVRTHLGHLLTHGDHALGYDLHGANYNSAELENYNGLDLPDVILINKIYEEKLERLKSQKMEVGDTNTNVSDLMFNLSLYTNGDIQPTEMASMTDGGEVLTYSSLVDEFEDLEIDDEEGNDDIMKE